VEGSKPVIYNFQGLFKVQPAKNSNHYSLAIFSEYLNFSILGMERYEISQRYTQILKMMDNGY